MTTQLHAFRFLPPLGTGGADGRPLIVGFVWLGTGGGGISADVIVVCISVGTNLLRDMREGRNTKTRLRAFFQSKILPNLPRRQALQ